MTKERLSEILESFQKIEVGVVGDACVDIYWTVDMKKSELSKETPVFPYPVVDEKVSLGAAGNCATNCAVLGANTVLLSLIGEDWRSKLFLDAMKKAKLSAEFLVCGDSVITPAYCKPLLHGISSLVYEAPRLDFANTTIYSKEIEDRIISKLRELSEKVDLLIVVDQLEYLVNENVRHVLNEIAQTKMVFIDSRYNISKYPNCIIKPNEHEAFQALNPRGEEPESFSAGAIKEMGAKLKECNKKGVLITAGKNGAYWFCGNDSVFLEALSAEDPIDVVGCGDNFMACFAVSYAAGCSIEECLTIAMMGGNITVKKIGMTGSSSPQELLSKYEEVYKK